MFATPIVPRIPEQQKARGEDKRDMYGRVDLESMKKFRVGSGSRWFKWILEGLPDDKSYVAPAIASERSFDSLNGRTEQVLLNMGSTAAHVIQHLVGFQKSSNIDDTWQRAYCSAFPTPESCIGALNFPLDAW